MRLCIVGVGVLMLGIPSAGQEQPSGSVLNRMHAYLRSYETELSSVVADERFDQNFVALRTRNVAKGNKWRVKRQIDSEVSFLRLPGQNQWLGFRDVRKVDGRPLSNPGPRVVDVLQGTKDLLEQAKTLADASAAHNLGLPRTINVPTAVLEILHPAYRARFRYTDAGTSKINGVIASILEFKEVVRPTVVRQPNGGNIVSSGHVWVETNTGRILKAEWYYDSEPHDPAIALRPKLTVYFEFNAPLGFMVPVKMEEIFSVPYGNGDGIATYRNFRRFGSAARIVEQ